MLTTRLKFSTASLRGGFTLVELLVVIGIIAILAGVALGPITNGIKKAKQSSGLQSAHALGLAMYSAANDNNQLYPDYSGTAAGSSDNIAATLLAGGYVTDATIFHLSADTAGAAVTSANNTATTIIGTGVTSWDFLGNGGSGVSSTKFNFLPIVWSTVNTGTEPSIGASLGAGAAVTAVPTTASPFGTDGVAVFYINNAAAFVPSTVVSGNYLVNIVTAGNNLGTDSTTGNYKAIPGK